MTENVIVMSSKWDRKSFLDKMYRPVTGQGVWSDRTNQEVRESYNTSDVAVIKRRRAEWLGHIIRMDQTRGNKNIF
jgi:hypothetical protein